MTFAFGVTSKARLTGVNPILVSVFTRAIALSAQDFGVFEGLRSIERQKALLAAHASKTMASKHLLQADGTGHAGDLVPFIDGQFRWEWGAIYETARAVRQAAVEQKAADIHWGGVWDQPLISLPDTTAGIQAAVSAYCARHAGPDFIDGPHFQLGA